MSVNTIKPLSHYLKRGENSFGILRILAASAVVFSHAWTTTNGSTHPEPLQIETGYPLGWHAVNLFFALSGMLIAGSLHSQRSISAFFVSRLLRIYPALVAVILATAILSAAIVNPEIWSSKEAAEYVLRNLFLIGASATIPGVYADIPEQYMINVPLWTLKFEVFAYFTVAGFSYLTWKAPRLFSLKYLTLFVLIFGSFLMLTFGRMEVHGFLDHTVRLTFAFYIGVACWLWRDQIRITLGILVGLIALNVILLWLDFQYIPAQIILLGALAIYVGTIKYGIATEFTDKQDYSYGIYIVGYPIQQGIMAVTNVANPWQNFLFAMMLAVPVAAISWNLVEKPALRLKNTLLFGTTGKW